MENQKFMRRTVLGVLILILASVWFIVAVTSKKSEPREYHPAEIAKLNDNIHTHIVLQGWITYKVEEEDGDWHFRVCDSPSLKKMDRDHCVVVEVIPAMSSILSEELKKGDKVEVRGIARFDKEANHEWNEIHPAESIKLLNRKGK
jgi:hypothetical protein